MPLRFERYATATAAIVSTLSACSAPQTEPPVAHTPPARPANNDAPRVPTPLDTTKFQKDPCSALTESQAAALNLPSRGEDVSDSLGPRCVWHDTTELKGFGLHFNTLNPRGLQDLYTKKRLEDSIHLERIPDIQDHPAIIFTSTPELLKSGECAIAVGASDELAFTVHNEITDEAEKADPCKSARRFADAVLTTMKKG